jgi:hypothetical protein
LELNNNQGLQYRTSAAGGNTNIFVQGYYEEVA